MTDADFEFLRTFVHARSGLSLGPEKRYLVESRIGMLCRRRGIADLATLVRDLRLRRDGELGTAVVEAMTTNETLFFRDTAPFDLFRSVILPERLAANAGRRRLRIWCAAVSSGQEGYSLAMILDEFSDRLSGWELEILGTDIAGEVLAKAREAVYSQFEVQRGLPIRLLLKHFTQEGDRWRIVPRLRAMVTFRQHNLLEPCAHLGEFDVIFCRNVLIYFDVPTKTRVLEALVRRLAPGGSFVLGAAETAMGLSAMLTPDPVYRGLFRAAAERQRPAAAPAGRPSSPVPHRASR